MTLIYAFTAAWKNSDIGNALTGGLSAMTSVPLHTGGREQKGEEQFIMNFLKSIPFDTYMNYNCISRHKDATSCI